MLTSIPPAQQGADKMGAQPTVGADLVICDGDRLKLVGAFGLLMGQSYKGCAEALQRVLDNDAAAYVAAQTADQLRESRLMTL